MKRRNYLLLIVIGVAIGVFLKLFIFDILSVSGTSMTPTIKDGGHIFVWKLQYGIVKPFGVELLCQWAKPQKGDLVVYIYNNKTVVKRCVAIEGEVLEFSTDTGYSLLVGGQTISLTEEQYQRIKHSTTVPEGTILAVGDNYSSSIDSRNYGFVSIKNILGKVAWN